MPTFGPASIAAGADDGNHRPGSAFTPSDPPKVGDDFGTKHHAWLWFDGVTIDQGATIDTMTVDGTSASGAGTTVLTLWAAVDEDDAAKPTNSTTCTTDDGIRTAAQVTHDFADVAIFQAVNSPDLAAIGQELVDRAGWVSGNAMLIHWFDDGSTSDYQTIYDYENATYDPAELTITYIEPASGGFGWGPIPFGG